MVKFDHVTAMSLNIVGEAFKHIMPLSHLAVCHSRITQARKIVYILLVTQLILF